MTIGFRLQKGNGPHSTCISIKCRFLAQMSFVQGSPQRIRGDLAWRIFLSPHQISFRNKQNGNQMRHLAGFPASAYLVTFIAYFDNQNPNWNQNPNPNLRLKDSLTLPFPLEHSKKKKKKGELAKWRLSHRIWLSIRKQYKIAFYKSHAVEKTLLFLTELQIYSSSEPALLASNTNCKPNSNLNSTPTPADTKEILVFHSNWAAVSPSTRVFFFFAHLNRIMQSLYFSAY